MAGLNPIQVPAISAAETEVFVLARRDADLGTGPTEIRFVLEPMDAPETRIVRKARFVAPGGGNVL